MKVGMPIWAGRVSPVLDAARELLVVESVGRTGAGRRQVPLAGEYPHERAGELRELGLDVLICGAVSWPLEAMLTRSGIRVIADVCGPVDEVLEAFFAGRLDGPAYRMPGCHGRVRSRRRCRGGQARRWAAGPL